MKITSQNHRDAFLKTERLKLLAPEKSDLELLEKLYTDPKTMAFLGGPNTRETVSVRLEKWIEGWKADTSWNCIIQLVRTNARIGSVGIFANQISGESVLEAGWMLLPEYWGKGYAYEAVKALITSTRGKFPETPIAAFPSVTNVPSNRICEKLGFSLIQSGLKYQWLDRELISNYWRLDPQSSQFDKTLNLPRPSGAL